MDNIFNKVLTYKTKEGIIKWYEVSDEMFYICGEESQYLGKEFTKAGFEQRCAYLTSA